MQDTTQKKTVALVTGANQGIGLQIAKDLVTHGFTVLVGSRNFERGEAAAREVGPDARALQLDVTDQSSIAAAAERIRKEFGRLDVLVNNAAISNTSKAPGMSISDYARLTRASNVSLAEVRAVWETNVFGVLAVYQAMLPLLREGAGGPHRQCVERRWLADDERGPGFCPPLDLRPRLSRLQDRSQRHNACHGDRTGVDWDQGQCRLPWFHQDQPQQLCGHGDGGGGRPRGGGALPCSVRRARPVHSRTQSSGPSRGDVLRAFPSAGSARL